MSPNYVEILSFKAFHKNCPFLPEGENGRKEVLKHYVDVSVGIDLV